MYVNAPTIDDLVLYWNEPKKVPVGAANISVAHVAQDAYIIAETVRTMPQTLRGITMAEEQVVELSMLCGFDDDLALRACKCRNC